MAKKRQFILLYSTCGSLSQVTTTSSDGEAVISYPSLDAAKKASPGCLAEFRDSDGETPSALYVAEIVAYGKPSGVAWD